MHGVTAPARHLTIRGVPAALAKELDAERRRRGSSLNQTVISLLSRSLGLSGEPPPRSGLEKLSGSWSEAELTDFQEATRAFGNVDEELWK